MSHQDQDNTEASSKLWMGDLEPYMDENYLKGVFAYFGYHLQGVKWIHDRHTMTVARYCFVIFNDHIVAKQVLDKLNNQPIPGSGGTPWDMDNFSAYTVGGRSVFGLVESARHFKLNWASKKVEGGQQDHTIFVGDLSKDVTSQMLQDFFQQNYSSVRYAKVVEDENGASKGYGFVRFLDESERNDSFKHLNGVTGLGKKAITIREASAPKQRSMLSPSTHHPPLSSPSPVAFQSPIFTPPCTTYTPSFWTSGMVLDPVQQHQQQQHLYATGYQYPYSVRAPGSTRITSQHSVMNFTSECPTEDLVEPSIPLDIEEINRETFHRDNELYSQLDSIRWITKYSQAAGVL